MEMSLIHAGLAAGAALAALPVILHLFMRQTPKHVIFPALRLLRERQKQSKKRMRIKNWLLLLARMAILALMALALARPRVYSEVPLGDESQPMALGLVFDTSLSMEYKDKDKTRLEEAKERAKEIIAKIPDSSLVFVVDSGEPGVPIGLSPAAALKRIEGLTIRVVNRPLNAAMGQVYPAVAECERPVHVVYVLTDLARTSWQADHPRKGSTRPPRSNEGKGAKIATFVWRLTPQEIQNVSIVAAEPESSVVTQGEPVEIRARIRSVGTTAVTRLVEFEVDGVKKGEKSIDIAHGQGRAGGDFHDVAPARGRRGPCRQGEAQRHARPVRERRRAVLRLQGPSPAQGAVGLRHPLRGRVCRGRARSGLSGQPPARTWSKRSSRPDSARRRTISSPTHASSCSTSRSSTSPNGERSINMFMRGAGWWSRPVSAASPKVTTTRSPASSCPRSSASDPRRLAQAATFGKVANITHPLFQRYGKDLDTVLAMVPVYRYWPIKQPVEGTHTLLSYSDGAPALLERTFKGPKTGRVLLWTTPLSRRPDVGGDLAANLNAWSELPSASYWPFLVLMDQTVPYLAGASNEQLNFEAGENVLLKLEPTARFTKFLVTGPDPKTKPRLVPSPSNDFLEVIEPPDLGIWSVKATAADNRTTMMGFSVNVPDGESKFDPL